MHGKPRSPYDVSQLIPGTLDAYLGHTASP